MDENTFQLIITNKFSDNQDKNLIIKNLSSLFKISEQKAEQLLSKPRTIVKSNIDNVTAEKYLIAVRKTGADCRIVNTCEKEPSLQEKSLLPSELDNISGKYFCPQCGTIKEDSVVCLNCGFDPSSSKVKKTNNKKVLKYAGIMFGLIVVMITTYLLALPAYNTYANKNRVLDGLQLASDTRDKITSFILKTNFWPNQNIDVNLEKNINNEIIESIVVGENAVMTVTLRAEPLNTDSSKTIVFKPSLLQGKLVWNCTKGTLDDEFRPSMCKRSNQ